MKWVSILILCFLVLTGVVSGAEAVMKGTEDVVAAEVASEAVPEHESRVLDQIRNITESPRYTYSTWAWKVVDLSTKEILTSQNPRTLMTPGSVVKLFTTATALETLGPDYRFTTPVYAGDVPEHGKVLVLVASGDPTMGGRNLPDGTISFSDVDHMEANHLPGASLTPTNPLAGLDVLAAEVAGAGIREVSEVVIDDRLFPTIYLSDPNPVTPIMINDNVIDVLVAPSRAGELANVTWRPQASTLTVRSEVMTVSAGSATEVMVTEQEGTLLVQGQVPEDSLPVLRIWQVPDAASFARTLFIEALQRQNVTVLAPAAGRNPLDLLPNSYPGWTKVATLISPPLSEEVKLILKVSLNLHANQLVSILGIEDGKGDFERGLSRIGEFISRAGIDNRSLSLVDGEGSIGNRVSPEALTALLLYMDSQKSGAVFREALPVMGVDGSLAGTVPADSPAYGNVQAKTGSSAGSDMAGLMTFAKSLAGYAVAKGGREVTFAVSVNNVRITSVEDLLSISGDMGRFSEAVVMAF